MSNKENRKNRLNNALVYNKLIRRDKKNIEAK